MQTQTPEAQKKGQLELEKIIADFISKIEQSHYTPAQKYAVYLWILSMFNIDQEEGLRDWQEMKDTISDLADVQDKIDTLTQDIEKNEKLLQEYEEYKSMTPEQREEKKQQILAEAEKIANEAVAQIKQVEAETLNTIEKGRHQNEADDIEKIKQKLQNK